MTNNRQHHSKSCLAGVAMLFEASLFGLALLLGWVLNCPVFHPADINARAFLIGGLATLPPVLLMLALTRSKWQPFLRLVRDVEEILLPFFGGCSKPALAGLAFLAGLGEEALFRGVIQVALAAPLGIWVSLLSTSVLFGLAHLLTPTYALLAAAMGLYLGGLLVATQSLVVPVVVHGLYDCFALWFLVARESGKKSESWR